MLLTLLLFKVQIIVLMIFSQYLESTGGKIDWSVYKPRQCVYDENYDREFKEPILIYSRLIITDVYDVDEGKMEFAMQIYFTETWDDPEINFGEINLTKAVIVPNHIRKCIFQPDTIFPNCKTVELYDQTLPNLVVKVVPGNSFYRYARYKLLVNCPMDFYRYPMDQQKCDVHFALLSSRSDTADLRWLDEKPKKHRSGLMKKSPNIQIFEKVKPLQFSMASPTSSSKVFRFTSGNSTILICSIVFSRPLVSSMLNTFVPSFLVVCLSFLSFWLDVRAIPGRVTLGVTALLTLATQIVHARSSLPSLDYMTAMDIWLFGCLIMVFSALLEFTIAQAWSRRNDKNKIDIYRGIQLPWSLREGFPIESKCCLETRKLIIELINFVGERTLNTEKQSTRPDQKEASSISRPKEGLNDSKKGIISTTDQTTIVSQKIDNIFDRVSRCLFPFSLVTFTVFYGIYYFK